MGEILPLRTVSYVSRVCAELTDEDVYEIAREARENNAIDGVTGLMTFDGKFFVQITEGASPSIDDLLERIEADDRHDKLHIIRDEIVETRSFSGWAMALAMIDDSRRLVERVEAVLSRSLDDGTRETLATCSAFIAAHQDASMTKMSPS